MAFQAPNEKGVIGYHETRQAFMTTLHMATKNRLRVIPLGGAGEVGRNCWALEYDNDVLILDMGVMFPDAEMLGVDLILPDVTYLQERKANIRGVFITHGHEDHIGAIPYLLRDILRINVQSLAILALLAFLYDEFMPRFSRIFRVL